MSLPKHIESQIEHFAPWDSITDHHDPDLDDPKNRDMIRKIERSVRVGPQPMPSFLLTR